MHVARMPGHLNLAVTSGLRGLSLHAVFIAQGSVLSGFVVCCAQLGTTVQSIFGNLGVQPLAATVTTGDKSKSFEETPANDDNQAFDNYSPSPSP